MSYPRIAGVLLHQFPALDVAHTIHSLGHHFWCVVEAQTEHASAHRFAIELCAPVAVCIKHIDRFLATVLAFHRPLREEAAELSASVEARRGRFSRISRRLELGDSVATFWAMDRTHSATKHDTIRRSWRGTPDD